jgi:RNA polymerase sigma factor for flagellar operon FliA
VERLSPLVRRAAIRLARRLPSTVSVADLVRAGLAGLSDALATVDAEGPELEAYLWYRIRRSMLDFADAHDREQQELVLASRRLVGAIGQVSSSPGLPPDEAQIAAALGLSGGDYRGLLGMLAQARMTGLDLQLAPPSSQTRGRRRSAGGASAELAMALEQALAELPPQLQQLLALRHQGDSSLEEIGAALALSEARVLELEVEAVHRLRAGMMRG